MKCNDNNPWLCYWNIPTHLPYIYKESPSSLQQFLLFLKSLAGWGWDCVGWGCRLCRVLSRSSTKYCDWPLSFARDPLAEPFWQMTFENSGDLPATSFELQLWAEELQRYRWFCSWNVHCLHQVLGIISRSDGPRTIQVDSSPVCVIIFWCSKTSV